MKIAILGCRGYPSTYGGFETFVRRLAPYLVEKGHDVTVYCREPGVSLAWHSTRTDGIRQVFTPGCDRKSLSTLSFGATATVDLLFRRADAVLVLNVANGFYLHLIKSRSQRAIVNVDGIEWDRGKWSRLGKWVFRQGAMYTAKLADDIVCDSQAISEIWKERFGRAGLFIPYGADVISERAVDRIRSIGLESRSFGLVVARLAPENNIELILDAIELLPPDSSFVVVGSANYDSPILDRLRRMAAERCNFHWLGHVSDQDLLLDLWFHCCLYIHGHSVGGTNPALLQALGCGAPVLALDTPFNREVVEDGEMLFPHDASRLAGQMMRMLRSPSPRDRSHRVVEERYRWEDCCSAYVAALVAEPISLLNKVP